MPQVNSEYPRGKKFRCFKCFPFQISLFCYTGEDGRGVEGEISWFSLLHHFVHCTYLFSLILLSLQMSKNDTYVSLSITNLGLWAALDNAELQEKFKD